MLRGTRRRGPRVVAVLTGILAAGSVAVGGAVAARTGSSEAADDSYQLKVDAVAYHLPGYTASGLPVGKGVVAVDPRLIPLRTRLFVPGYGKAIAADVGIAIKGRIIDLWMPSTPAARKWGRKTVTITVYR